MNNWSPSASLELLNIACRAAGVSYEEVELIRFGTNAVYRLDPLGLAARVSRPGYQETWVRREMAVTRWLLAHRFPAVPPADQVASEPIRVHDSLVTFWPWMDPSPEQITSYDFGRLIRGLHQVSAGFPPGHLPPWDPMVITGNLIAGLAVGNAVSARDIDLLRRWHEWIGSRLRGVPSVLGEGMIHGDAHIGNVLMTPQGPRLLDFDYVCHGPREWDLIPETLGPRRFGRPRENYHRFAEGYGFDVTTWPGFRVTALARELMITCWRLGVEASSTVRAEGERRLRYWRREPEPPGWRSF